MKFLFSSYSFFIVLTTLFYFGQIEQIEAAMNVFWLIMAIQWLALIAGILACLSQHEGFLSMRRNRKGWVKKLSVGMFISFSVFLTANGFLSLGLSYLIANLFIYFTTLEEDKK